MISIVSRRSVRDVKTSAAQSLRDLNRNQYGGAAIEFAIVAAPLVLFLFGITETSRAIWTQNALQYAADAAARCMTNNAAACGTTSEAQSYAASRSGAGFASSVFTATASATCGNVLGNQVSASYTMNLLIPFGTYSLKLTAQSCYPINNT
jgi:Flp pilus assembly protein TadG